MPEESVTANCAASTASHGRRTGTSSIPRGPANTETSWITDAAGENPRQIGDARRDRDEVAVTPDGHYIQYQSKGKIWRMNADGGGATQLTHGALDVHPLPSADGREVFCSSFDPWSPGSGVRRP